jgi:hypothetical protein
VLTYKRRQWPDLRELFRATVRHWYALRKRLRKVIGDFRYLQTWEITQRGTPHVNVAISSRFMTELIADQGCWVADARRKLGMRWQWFDHGASFKGTILEPMQLACGYGKISTLEPMDDRERMAGYMTKLARELTGQGGKSQVPVNAPSHFRRLRASQDTLPPRKKDKDLTGRLEFSYHPDYAREHHLHREMQAIASRYRNRISYSSGVALIAD